MESLELITRELRKPLNIDRCGISYSNSLDELNKVNILNNGLIINEQVGQSIRNI